MTRRHTRWLAVAAAVILLFLVIGYNSLKMAQQANRPVPARPDNVQAADVSVVRVRPDTYSPAIEAFGAVTPRYELTLAAEVSGQVVSMADNLESGRLVRQGELLVQLEDTDYRAALATAEKDLASARLDLLEEEREASQARAEWQSSGIDGEPDSPLVLHEPQLALARAAVAEAEAAVASARLDLERTRIRAPFDALVIARYVSPGTWLQAGSEVADLYSTDRAEISLPLSQHDWANLPDADQLEQGDWPVRLTSVETGQSWQGHVQRIERHLDDSSRQQSLIVAVDQPLAQTPPLAPGIFVRAEIPGRKLDGLWRLPPSALSQRGEIWYVADGVLQKFAREPVASDDEAIYVRPPESLSQQETPVLVHPLSGYVPGMAVRAVEASDD